jgi:hypothetical protein
LADFEFNDPPAADGDLVFDPLLFTNPPVRGDGALSFVFWHRAPATSDLAFGGVDGKPKTVPVAISTALPALEKFIPPPAEFVEFSVLGVLPGLTLAAQKRPSVPLSVVAALPMPVMVAEARYRTNTQRPTVGETTTGQQVATKFQDGPTHPQQDARHAPVGWEAFFQRVTGSPAGVEHRLPDVFQKLPVQNEGAFQDATGLHALTLYSQQDATRTHQQRAGSFQEGTDIRGDTLFRHQDGTKVHGQRDSRYQESLRFHVRGHSGRFQTASQLLKGLLTHHQDGVPPPPGISILLPPVDPPLPVCYTPSGELVFEFPWVRSTHLRFVCDGYVPPPPVDEPVVIPVQRVYIVINNLALRRASDNAVVPAFNFTLSLDVASWSWGFSASLPGSAQALVEPTNAGPVELRAWVNGTEFRVLAEQVGRERAFGQSSIRVSGRGCNAVLDAPYSPRQVFGGYGAFSSQQLMDEVLKSNGVPLGWDIDYGLEAWNVPANVFNHAGTYISALTALAQAGGGYLIPHPSAQSFKVRHLYPVAPWDWADEVPDFILPSAVVTREGVTWTEKPGYNRVFVSGQEQGVLGQVTRAGTAGEVLAPMVTDPLITTAAAARQRGLSILSNTGRQLEHQLRLPVLPVTGIIQPGALVEYTDNGEAIRGLVRSVQVDAQMPDVYQTLGVECHV